MKDNKLIAEFMGLQFSKGEYYRPLYNSGDWIPENELQYHTSWDWLMPVIEKLNLLDDYKYTVFISSADTKIVDNITNNVIVDISCKHSVDELIQSVYQAVVEFIKAHKKYPFNEGDDYWVEEDGDLVWGVWDDVSEELHDENPNRQYFTEEEVMDHIRAYGVKLYKQ
jgi:hypothetical protein